MKQNKQNKLKIKKQDSPVRPYRVSGRSSFDSAFLLLILFVFALVLVRTTLAQGAAQMLTQSDWVTGNVVTPAKLPVTDWDGYGTKDEGVRDGAAIELIRASYTMTQTSNDGTTDTCDVQDCATGGGFNAGTFHNTQVKRAGSEAFVELATEPLFKDWTNALLGAFDTAGEADDVVVAGGYAYVVDSGDGLKIINVSDPAAPLLTGSYDTTGTFMGIAVQGDYAFIAADVAGLIAVNVSNKSNPVAVNIYKTNGKSKNVIVDGDIAYLADEKKGFRVVDVSNPANMSLMTTYDTPGEALDVALKGNILFVADGATGLMVFDVSTPSSPAHIITLDTGTAKGVTVSGDLAFVTDDESYLNIIDISDPADPQLLSTYIAGTDGRVKVDGHYAYVADKSFGLRVLDISAPQTPLLVGTHDTPGTALGVDAVGDYVYVADGTSGLRVLDAARPAAVPVLKGTHDTPGNAWDVVVDGNTAYVGDRASGLKIINVSTPASPALLATFDTTGNAFGIAVHNDKAYVASGSAGLKIVDVSVPASPALIGSYDTPGTANDVAVEGNYAFVADNGEGVHIINVTTPSSPALTATITVMDTAYGVDARGHYVFIADGNAGVHIIDASSPASPALVKTYDTPGSAREIVVRGNRAYIADHTSGLLILDITDYAAPVLLGAYDTLAAKDIAVLGNTVFVADGGSGMLALDVADPANPVLQAAYNTNGTANGVAVKGWYAYVADDDAGMHIFDISSAKFANPALAGTYNTTGTALSVDVSGQYAFVADQSSGLHIIDIAAADDPVLTKSVSSGNAVGIAATGNYAYIADGNTGLRVVNINTATLAGSLSTSGTANDVSVVGDTAFMANGMAGLQIINIANPSKPETIGGYDTTGSARAVAVVSNKAYVADGNSGLQIIDVSDAASPRFLGTLNTDGSAYDVAVSGNYAYVADGSEGLQIIDVSNAAAPALVATYDTAGSTTGVAISGDYAFVADGSAGMKVINVAVPYDPLLVASYDTDGDAKGIVMAGIYAYVADSQSGLQIIKVNSFVPSGTFESPVIDLGALQDFETLAWNPAAQPANTALTMELQAGTTPVSDCPGACVNWGAYNPVFNNLDTGNAFDNNRYYRYRASLSTNDPSVSPQLNDFSLSFPAYSPQAGLESAVFDTGDDGGFLTDIAWSETLNGHDARVQIATSADNINWNYCGKNTCSAAGWLDLTSSDHYYADSTGDELNMLLRDANADRYFKYKVWLMSSDGQGTPVVDDVRIGYDTAHLELYGPDGNETLYSPEANTPFNIIVKVKDSANAAMMDHDGTRTVKLTSSVKLPDADGCTSSFTGEDNTEFSKSVKFIAGEASIPVTLCATTEAGFKISAREILGGALSAADALTISKVSSKLEADLTTSQILRWVAPEECATFSHYEVWYDTKLSVDRGNGNNWDDSHDPALAFCATETTTVTGLDAGVAYYFRIFAMDTFGNSVEVVQLDPSILDAEEDPDAELPEGIAAYDVLIKLNDNVHSDPEEDERGSYKHGDVVMVMPAGHNWSETERKSFLIIQMNLTEEEAADLTKVEKEAGKVVRRRAQKIDMKKFGLTKSDMQDKEKVERVKEFIKDKKIKRDMTVEIKKKPKKAKK